MWKAIVNQAQTLFDGVSGGLKPHATTDGYFGTDLEFMLAFDIAYLLIVFLGCAVMKQVEKPFTLKYVKIFHNFFLFALSPFGVCSATCLFAAL